MDAKATPDGAGEAGLVCTGAGVPDIEALIYISRAARPFAREQLEEMGEKFSAANERRGLTGVLIAIGDHFLQVLEGERDALNEVALRIAADRRHFDFKELYRGGIPERAFADWGMRLILLDRRFLLPLQEIALLRRELDAQIDMAESARDAIVALVLGLPTLLKQYELKS